MKWSLFILACVCVCLAYRLGIQVETIEASESGYAAREGTTTAAAVGITAGYIGGALGASIIGAASALGAALIQVSENRRKS